MGCQIHSRIKIWTTDLKSVLNRELPLGSLGGNLYLDGCVNLNFISSVRHWARYGKSTFSRAQDRLYFL